MSEAVDPVAVHEALVARVLARPGVVVLLGGIDSGKTTVARTLLAAALEAGHEPVLLDTDVGQSTVGPPTTIGLRHIRDADDIADPFTADALYFVGDITPLSQLLPLLTGTARLLEDARRRSRLVVVDTSGLVTGVLGQTLKFHKLELARPDHVVGLQRGAELEPLLGVARRFTPAEVTPLPVHPDVVPTGVEERAERRRARLERYFSGELHRFRVKESVFMPSLPPGFDLSLLHGMLVSLEDGRGACIGLGVLEHDDSGLRLKTVVDQVPSGLRLGSTRVDSAWRPRAVDVASLLGSA